MPYIVYSLVFLCVFFPELDEIGVLLWVICKKKKSKARDTSPGSQNQEMSSFATKVCLSQDLASDGFLWLLLALAG